ncbi:MAG: valine--pyruvate transaminase [Candidatus Eutrophobiaceae bacterium]
MNVALSRFGERYGQRIGIVDLMDDLGNHKGSDLIMLGGGHPARIPAITERLRHIMMERIAKDPERFAALIGDYEFPSGNIDTIQALAGLLKREYGWPVTERNIVFTAGSQSGFFQLFNLIAGEFSDGSYRRILLPAVPEYMGYADLGVHGDLFYSHPSKVEELGAHEFKYRIDFDSLRVLPNTAAICVSRPTNPTGNVLCDEEMLRLRDLAAQHDIPLIVDSAYGAPFPNLVHVDQIKPIWDEDMIHCMSLSKLGLPGTRTGIIVAGEEIASLLARMNGVLHLAIGNLGMMLVREMIESGEILELCRNTVQPWYAEIAHFATECAHRELLGLDYQLHRPEGAMFLWLRFPGLPISSQVLYERLKARGVLVVSGHHFFPGLLESWVHREECIRVSYAAGKEAVAQLDADLLGELKGIALHKIDFRRVLAHTCDQ